MRYGLPYKGSKNTIAEWVVSHFPKREHFYDLFCGGCAITHAAMLKGIARTYTINDVLDMPRLFIDTINGKYRDERRWISREDFQRLRDTDPYVKTCWSFGNNGRSYLYSKEIEPWKKALHYARVLGDLSLLEAFGIKGDGSSLDIKRNAPEYKEKYIKWYMEKALNRAGVESLESLESLERLQSLESLERLQSLESLELFRGDYQNVEIKPDSLIYCDIPYRGTDRYSKAGFDHERFYSWAERQTEPVIISEYDMPAGRFICMDEIKKLCTLNANNNSLKKNERLFIPRTQEKLFIQKKTQWQQLELF